MVIMLMKPTNFKEKAVCQVLILCLSGICFLRNIYGTESGGIKQSGVAK